MLHSCPSLGGPTVPLFVPLFSARLAIARIRPGQGQPGDEQKRCVFFSPKKVCSSMNSSRFFSNFFVGNYAF